MIHNQAQNEADIWKQKYLDNLEQLESCEKEFEDGIHSLSQGILSICRLSAELYPKLEPKFSLLRTLVKSNPVDKKIPDLLRDLESNLDDIISSNNQEYDKATIALKNATAQLLELELSYFDKRQLKKFDKSLEPKTKIKFITSELIENFSDLQANILSNFKSNKKSKKTNTENKKKSKDTKAKSTDISQDTANDHEFSLSDNTDTIENPSPITVTEIYNTSPIAKRILLELLRKLDIPNSHQKIAKELSIKIEDQFNLHKITDYLRSIKSLIFATISNQQNDYRDFLHQLGKQLDYLQKIFHQVKARNENKQQENTELNQSISNIMKDIDTAFDESNDLTTLKSLVNQKLTHIADTIIMTQKNDFTHTENLINKIDTLSIRLQEIEVRSQHMQHNLENQKILAELDSVTQLPNRNSYENHIKTEYANWLQSNSNLSLIIGDIDHFKKINDSLGHLAGDKALKIISQLISRNVRRSDFVARYGGEEFIIILPDANQQAAAAIAEKLRHTIENSKFRYSETNVEITMSFGVSQFNKGDTIESVFERADQALYKVKNDGRNQVYQSS